MWTKKLKAVIIWSVLVAALREAWEFSPRTGHLHTNASIFIEHKKSPKYVTLFKIICKYGTSQPKSDESFCLPKQYLPTKFFEAQNHILAKGKKKPFNHYSLNFPFQRLLPVFFSFIHLWTIVEDNILSFIFPRSLVILQTALMWIYEPKIQAKKKRARNSRWFLWWGSAERKLGGEILWESWEGGDITWNHWALGWADYGPCTDKYTNTDLHKCTCTNTHLLR